MMKKMAVVVVLAALSSAAMADKDKAAMNGEAKAVDAAKMAAPKAPVENDVLKKWVGTWWCEGSSKGPDGTDMKYKTTWSVKSTLNGMWFAIDYKRPKDKAMPGFEGQAHIGYDSVGKRYMFFGADTMGGWINLTSSDGMSYAGDGVPMGRKSSVKFSFAKGKDKKGEESDKLLEVKMDFGGMIQTESCKK
jgi:hypothetical protein